MTTQAARWRVHEQRTVDYEIVESPHLFDPRNPALLSHGRVRGGRRFVVLDANVAEHHGTAIRAYFRHHGIDARIVIFPGGEENKNADAWLGLLRELDAFPIHRRDEPIIAIGGGVLTDVVGFVAGAHRRGVPHIKVPTSLMAYVDAAVGIKTGINFDGFKNRLGSFEAPQAVYLDRGFLRTLPRRHLLNGVCEILKLAIIRDAELFALLEREGSASIEAQFQNPAGGLILERAIGGMLAELAPNLWEAELDRSVDFGHTFSYGLETRHAGNLLHGEAVLLDMAVSVLIAQARGLLDEATAERVFGLISSLGLVLDSSVLDVELMWDSLLDRIEHRNGLQRAPMPAGLGRCVFLNDITRAELERSSAALHAWTGTKHERASQR